ncbi:hypothetical protein PFHG_04440 [Plasmodium falciparum HB3]|uniref:Pyrroline-5-carboxylate reductase n=1 Tax=Plasmodium falciparum (isolate HB3) TaxID=137071 RepID=A0A0L7KIC8_PLAFX|nr:hypothetical protein PFHG_04440 [Plasmodium falciparum HB3]
MENIKLGFMGLGQMGSALAHGIANANIIKKENLFYYGPSKKNTTLIYMSSNEELARHCHIIVCAVNPIYLRIIKKFSFTNNLIGSVEMVKKSDQPVQQLKDNIVSPGGITAVGLYSLEKNSFKYTVMNAVEAACEKSKAMGSK